MLLEKRIGKYELWELDRVTSESLSDLIKKTINNQSPIEYFNNNGNEYTELLISYECSGENGAMGIYLNVDEEENEFYLSVGIEDNGYVEFERRIDINNTELALLSLYILMEKYPIPKDYF